jgi:hypothetical protein
MPSRGVGSAAPMVGSAFAQALRIVVNMVISSWSAGTRHARLNDQGESDGVKVAQVTRSLAAALVVQDSVQFTDN